MTDEKLKALISQGVADVFSERDATRSRNGEDSHDSGPGVRRMERVAHECTYPNFMKCQPLNFKGTERVVELTQCFERTETMFRISKCTVENQIKFVTCTLLGSALTWWNSHVRTVGHDVAYAMTWTSLKKKMTDKYCPRGEMKKLEVELWDLKVKGTDVAEKKRKFDDTSRNNQNQQQPPKRHNVARAYAAGSGEKKPYGGSKHLCSKCNYHHDVPCVPKCHKCNIVVHLARDCRSLANSNTANNQRALGQVRKLLDIRTNPDSNVVTSTFLLNNHYASILFDTGADRSFVSTAFSSQIDIIPTALDYGVDVELADGRIIGVNTLIRGCTLNFLNHPFNINLMPVEMGSFDVIIGMDWLSKYQAVIVCAENIVRIP
ncbi:putative reverse transcriptase domain-containing protein [Tanacetum coccineum]